MKEKKIDTDLFAYFLIFSPNKELVTLNNGPMFYYPLSIERDVTQKKKFAESGGREVDLTYFPREKQVLIAPAKENKAKCGQCLIPACAGPSPVTAMKRKWGPLKTLTRNHQEGHLFYSLSYRKLDETLSTGFFFV